MWSDSAMIAPPRCPECGRFMDRFESHSNSYNTTFRWNEKQKEYETLEEDNTIDPVNVSYLCHDDDHKKIECYYADERGVIEKK
jgi:hypothetical protein